MDHDEWVGAVPGAGWREFLPGGRQPGLKVDGERARKTRHFQSPEGFVLVIEVGNAALKHGGVGRPRPYGVAGSQPQQEGIREPSTSMELDGQIEGAPAHAGKEVIQLA